MAEGSERQSSQDSSQATSMLPSWNPLEPISLVICGGKTLIEFLGLVCQDTDMNREELANAMTIRAKQTELGFFESNGHREDEVENFGNKTYCTWEHGLYLSL
ncbi:hypothetical protein ACET3Z_029671 [Daucus carota]